MTFRYEISNRDSQIHVEVYGVIDGSGIRELWAAIVEACDQYNCYDILGISDLDQPFTTMEAFDHHKVFSDVGVTYRHRIAWVNRDPESSEMLKFTETVLVNRGKLNGRLFSTIDEAKRWLHQQS